MKHHKAKIVLIISLSVALILAICYGFSKLDNAETENVYQNESVFFTDSSTNQTPLEEPEITDSSKENEEDVSLFSNSGTDTAESTQGEDSAQDEAKTSSPKVAEVPVKTYCTLSVRCDTIFDNIDRLKPEKQSIIPEDGIIFAEQRIEFAEGESVFDLLLRIMRENNIHLEFVKATLYNSAYIEGIANIYEKDCGSYSGWIYKVNGEISSVGCSSYFLKDGDRVEWVYTCNLGKDL